MNLNVRMKKTEHRSCVSAVLDFAADILCPKRCIMCSGFVDVSSKICICGGCRELVGKFGKVSVDDTTAYEEIVSALEYDLSVRDALMRYKFEGKRYLSHTFAWAVYQKIAKRKFLGEMDIICPVPIHPKRKRDYNQAALIAHDISRWTQIECIDDLLLKTKAIKPLSTMKYMDRRLLVRDSMSMNMKYDVCGKNILLVDDVFTSGATIAECARILRIYGAEKVYAVTACYVNHKPDSAAEDDNEGGTDYAYANLFTD